MAAGTYLDALLKLILRVFANGASVAQVGGGTTGLNFNAPLTAVANAATGNVDVGVGVQGPVTAPATAKGVTTVGNAASTLITTQLPTNSVGAYTLTVSSTDGTYPYVAFVTFGGATTSQGSGCGVLSGNSSSAAPLIPSVPPPTLGGPTITCTVQGPQATVTNAANNGSGKVRLTVSASVLNSSLTGKSLTISGLTTCTEANGTNAATYVGPTTFDLASVAIVHTGADSGTVVLATPPTWTWSASLGGVLAP